MGLILGLDIGVGTVGYGLIDSNKQKVISSGTRIFPIADVSNNLTRRTMRGRKRLLRRKTHRIDRVKYLLKNNNLLQLSKNNNYNPYKLRCKGLNEKLNIEELDRVLLHIVKRRGISYIDDIDQEIKENSNLNEVQDKLKELYVCEMQLEKMEKYQKTKNYEDRVRGITNALIPTSAYEKECRAILKKQSEYYEQITNELIEEFIEILKSKREYFVGPGNEKNRSDYGIYRTNGETLKNLFEILVGKCTIYKDEYRAARFSYTAQLFNILNDLNNISIDNEKLTYEQKVKIINKVLSSKTVNMMKIISKVTGKQVELISGYRINKDGKPEFHSFSSYRYVMNKLNDAGEDTSKITSEIYDEISKVLTLETEVSRKKGQLELKVPLLNKDEIKLLSEIKNTYFDGWHSLSIKAMNEIIDELFHTSKNQMEIFTERGMLKSNLEMYKGMKNVPENIIDKEILSPIAKRSIRQSLKIVNRIRDLYGELDSIVVEMAREVTTDPKVIEKEQRGNEKEKEAALNEALSEFSFDINKLSFSQRKKIRLWYQQEGKCVYTHKPIKISDLLYNNEMFDIDHIIPKSISFDDSMSNKILCYSKANRDKGNTTPFRYLSRINGDITYEEFKDFILLLYKNNKINRKKKELLLFEEDIQKIDVIRGFINRNLVDTRYATKVVLNTLQNYFKANNEQTKIYTVKGSFTNSIRKKWELRKNRSLYKNHAEDAIIISATRLIKMYKYSVYDFIDELSEEMYRIDKVIDDKEFDDNAYSPPIKGLVKQIRDFNYKYSYKIDTKVNRQVTDQNIYSTRLIDKNDYIIGKLKDIYGEDGEKLKKFIVKNPEKLLMYKNDIKSFEILKRVVEEYPNEKNPFAKYKEEYGEGMRKYSKNNNGPIIKQIKYVSKKLGACVDITNKYFDKNIEKIKHDTNIINKTETNFKEIKRTVNHKRVVSLKLKPLRIDVYKNKSSYKFAGVYYKDFKFEKSEYILDLEKYKKELINKKIDKSYEFLFSLYKYDRVNIVYDGKAEEWIFTSINDNNKNTIEIKHVDRKAEKGDNQLIRSIGNKVSNMKKIVSDVLGNEYKIEKEKLKLEF
ncbi:type II CRISPR RNA-guided endonuclease Cas9 [Clostridium sp. M14]|uniref:type II CRISPR RNA-guided endonuclease Cas9 n=1 Tax=Clostridium sp. M14 TaxID=2716311 RepID=UPI0013EE4ECC|nr:type II CRISPR RNA-guided endonuclease Cas9 [Clostridium sp. M14]MBZ9692414.1 type II CRISPR RNA-guided endonuclease Cas9 [Clostridium sp. M14]